jgi:uncharacterized SAM-dependent methyltransferase
MLYFKNRELAETYHVSDRTIRNWIEETKKGKLQLVLHEQGGRTFIANTTKNLSTIEGLVSARKKFRPHHTFKVITPKPEFYKLYSQGQVYDIVTSLEIHHEILRQYNYFDGGAASWDKYIKRLATEEAPNTYTRTIELLGANQSYIDSLIQKRKRVNIVDIGVGNAMPAKRLLSHLLELGVMGRYIAIDISPGMLQLAERNIKKWFGDKVDFEAYTSDINYDRFANILAEEYIGDSSDETINLILVFGGTLGNFRNPDGAFRIIHDSMGMKDLLVYANKLDTPNSRRYFDFNLQPGNATLAPNHRLIFDLLNMDASFYDVEMGFDEELNQRYIRVRLKVAIIIKFDFDEGERLIDLNKNDTILLWRNWQMSAMDTIHQFDRNDFYMLHSSQTDDQEYILTVSRVKTE